MQTKKSKRLPIEWQPQKLGKLIKTFRETAELTQEQLSVLIETDKSIISRLENGIARHPPTVKTISLLIKSLALNNQQKADLLLTSGRIIDYYIDVINCYQKMLPSLFEAMKQDQDFAIDIYAQSQEI